MLGGVDEAPRLGLARGGFGGRLELLAGGLALGGGAGVPPCCLVLPLGCLAQLTVALLGLLRLLVGGAELLVLACFCALFPAASRTRRVLRTVDAACWSTATHHAGRFGGGAWRMEGPQPSAAQCCTGASVGKLCTSSRMAAPL